MSRHNSPENTEMKQMSVLENHHCIFFTVMHIRQDLDETAKPAFILGSLRTETASKVKAPAQPSS
jgi:hypothetical protein